MVFGSYSRMTNFHRFAAFAIASAAAVPGRAETITLNNPVEQKIQNNGLPSTQGSTVTSYFLDGGNPPAGGLPGDAAHAYDFLRFDDLFGGAAPQLPAGAT